MRRHVAFISVIFLLITVLLPVSVSAAPASASLSGPAQIRAGDTITVTFNIKGSSISGFSGKIRYDADRLTLTRTSKKIASPWKVDFNNSAGMVIFVAYDDDLSAPINGSVSCFSMTFQVNQSLSEGAGISVTAESVVISSEGLPDIKPGNIAYSKSIAAPLSDNADLAELTVSNASLTPAFQKGRTAYTANVPYGTSKLSVKASPEDQNAKVSISNPELKAGAETVVAVTVTAQDSSKKVYKITVTRQQDPNYQKSANNNLKSITVSPGILSPVFQKNKLNYVVWLPYEITKIKVSGEPEDKAASVAVTGGDKLQVGDNPVSVTVTAENGSRKEYRLIVKRAPDPEGKQETSHSSEAKGALAVSETEQPGNHVFVNVVIAIVYIAFGFAVGFATSKIR